MNKPNFLDNLNEFSTRLYQKMIEVNMGIAELELYEFQYALKNITPKQGWSNIDTVPKGLLGSLAKDITTYQSIQLNPVKDGKIILDETIVLLTQVLLIGLVCGDYSVEWVQSNYYFDIRSFCFFFRTNYFNSSILKHFGNQPFRSFEPKQLAFESKQDIGYKEFKEANKEVDQAFLETLSTLVDHKGTPILIILAGPTGAGKTEITSRICERLLADGRQITTIEMDNYFKDRDYRDGKPNSKDKIHFDLFINSMHDILKGRAIEIPRYDFYQATSSHDLDGNLREGQTPMHIEPADVIFLEGNFPFHMPELTELIGLRIVYLTDDPIRLKRKWRRDIDYRKKYDPIAFVNRYFRTQFLRAQEIYLPLMEICDLVVDTTTANLWLTPGLVKKSGMSPSIEMSK